MGRSQACESVPESVRFIRARHISLWKEGASRSLSPHVFLPCPLSSVFASSSGTPRSAAAAEEHTRCSIVAWQGGSECSAACACGCWDIPSVSASPFSCLLCPAASSPSTGRRSRMGWCRTSDPLSHHPWLARKKQNHPVIFLYIFYIAPWCEWDVRVCPVMHVGWRWHF